MEEKLISIIVPVYNTEKYLERCLDSILKQTYHNYEVIIINDGSTDDSLSIALDYAEKDSRIRVIDKENEGISKTRNIGLDEVTGDYICFVDSDDYLKNSFIEELYNNISKNHVELSVCLFSNEYSNDCNTEIKKTEVGIKENAIINRREYIGEFSKDFYSVYYGALWNKMYKTQIICDNNINFDPTVDIGEDFIFNYKYLEAVDNVGLIDKYNYYYCHSREDALTKIDDVWHWWDMAQKRLVFCEQQLKKMDLYDKCEVNLDTAYAIELIAPTYDIIKENYKGFNIARGKLKKLYTIKNVKKILSNNQKKNMVHRIALLSLRLNNYGLFVLLMRIWIKIQK